MAKRILVMGGSYFLGKRFVSFAANSYEVTVFNRGSRPLNIPGVIELRGDRREPGALEAIKAKEYDAVIDFCAYQQGDIKAVVDALEGHIEKYIFLSTCDVYEHGTKKTLDENAPFEEQSFGGEAGAYISGKIALEKELDACSAKYRFHPVSLRPSIIYGPDNYAPREGIYFNWIEKSGQIIHPQDATGEFQMIFVDDVVKAIDAVLNCVYVERAYNLTPTPMVTYDSFADALSACAPFEKVTVPVSYITEAEIALPFALTKDESNYYDGLRTRELIGEYTGLEEGLKVSYDAFLCKEKSSEKEASNHGGTGAGADDAVSRYNKCIETIEKLFEENRPGEAEKFMLETLGQARMTEDRLLELQMLNELIGYYRQVSDKERLEAVMECALELAAKPELMNRQDGKLSYATTVLNVANGYRSIGALDQSKHYYEDVTALYSELLKPDDILYAGLHNNISLLYQELHDYKAAVSHLEMALDIVKANNAGFEIAVTYANLANSSAMWASDTNDITEKERALEAVFKYAGEAIARFEAGGTIDAHYCAALAALGTYYYERQQYNKAAELYGRGMSIVEKSVGRNSQYDRLKSNRDMCLEKCMNGLKLSRLYYEQVGLPMLKEKFGDYLPKLAIGLVGKGSDCFGYDDASSMDHDWGPDFCIWVPDDLYDQIGEELTNAYEALPSEFMGYRRTTTSHGKGRRGVFSISEFYRGLVGAKRYESVNWREIPDFCLAAAVNGEVFYDAYGEFTGIRNELMKGYPEEILYLKLAEAMAKASQAGQYNYPRMMKRDDRLTADIMLTDSIKQILILAHYLENKYPPHDKWLYRSFCNLDCASELKPLVDGLHNSLRLNDKEAYDYVNQTMDLIGDYVARVLYARDVISDINNYMDYHSDELVRKAEYAALTDDELVRKIAKTEFAAFDKVKNEGGRASCQNDWMTFSVMRKSQYMTWSRPMLLQYLYDFNREFEYGHNLITEKYGRMMESTAPDRYKDLESKFPVLSDEKKAVIQQIVAIQMQMLEEFAVKHPGLAGNARSFYTADDSFYNTSYETYLRGEISTYSDKMLQLYGRFVVECAQSGKNIAEMTITNTALLYGFESLEAFEKAGNN